MSLGGSSPGPGNATSERRGSRHTCTVTHGASSRWGRGNASRRHRPGTSVLVYNGGRGLICALHVPVQTWARPCSPKWPVSPVGAHVSVPTLNPTPAFELPQGEQPLESGSNRDRCRDPQRIPEPAPSPDPHSLYRHQYLSQNLTDGHQQVGLRTKLISICRAASIPVPEQTASAGDKSGPREEVPLRLLAGAQEAALSPRSSLATTNPDHTGAFLQGRHQPRAACTGPSPTAPARCRY